MKDESPVDIQPDAVAHEQDSYIMVDLTDIVSGSVCSDIKVRCRCAMNGW